MHNWKGKGRGIITNIFFFKAIYIFRSFYGVWVKLFRKKISLGMFWIFEYSFIVYILIGTPILLFIFNINKLSSVKYSIVNNSCIHYTVICLFVFNNICIVLWPMLSELKSLTLLHNECKDNNVCCWDWIKMSGFLKMKHPRQWNSSQGSNLVLYPFHYIKKKKIQAAAKRNNKKEKKFTGFENDFILAALAGFSVGQWKVSHGTIK